MQSTKPQHQRFPRRKPLKASRPGITTKHSGEPAHCSPEQTVIRLRGVRHNNLKNFDLDLPLHQLIVVTGLSGSGKSSLAFDTLFAEGQRRYIETFSPYARQFFDRMDKPQADSIEGIPPAIAIEQRNAVRTTRSTIGTMTELCDYMKMLWPHIAQLHCRQCGQAVCKDSPQQVWEKARREAGQAQGAAEVLITFDLPLTEKLTLGESLALIAKQGYQRLLIDGQIVRVDEVSGTTASELTVIQDRLKLTESNRPRFIEACEHAYHFGKGKLALRALDSTQHAARNTSRFSNRLHCAACDIEYREPSPALFSFNNPVGACPTCRGFGRTISIDYGLALPDRSRTLAQGVVKPWQTGFGLECQSDLMRMCRHFEIPTDVPFDKLPGKWQDFVLNGEPGYGKDEEHEWPRAWYGIKGYFRWLESKSYKMHVRVLLSRYRAYTTCPDCKGKRFQPEALLYRCGGASPTSERLLKAPGSFRKHEADLTPVPPLHSMERGPGGEARAAVPTPPPGPLPIRWGGGQGEGSAGLTLADFYQLPVRDALRFVDSLACAPQLRPNQPLGVILGEVRSRLGYLNEVGLGYLTLDRPTRTLSGGETERVSLTTCLGTRLVNTLFVLDEPSVGLHPRDTERLVRILEQLRDAGNTVLAVEHEASIMRAANQIVDLGPGHGATGGQVVFQGSYPEILKSDNSLTGQYLSGRKQIKVPARRPVGPEGPERPTPIRRAWGPGPKHARSESGAPARYSLVGSEAQVLHDTPNPLGPNPSISPTLTLSHANRHNLKDLTIEIPLGRFVCVTGVSGSGKTTLVREVLLPALVARLHSEPSDTKASDRLDSKDDSNGAENPSQEPGASPLTPRSSTLHLPPSASLSRVILVDQSLLGKTPRSNPAVYIGAFDEIREFFAASEIARQRGLNASAFSFNSSQGQCERCRGAGFEKIEMQFLSDVFIRCPDCHGRRYRAHILEVKLSPENKVQSPKSKVGKIQSTVHSPKSTVGRSYQLPTSNYQLIPARTTQHATRPLSIADVLDSTVEEAIDFLGAFPESRQARRAAENLKLLAEVGLGYLKLGQPINTLSGGESQRLKLVKHLAECFVGNTPPPPRASPLPRSPLGPRNSALTPPSPTLFLFDEPTTGLHFEDVRVLLKVFQRLVDAGHSVLVIEHNLDVIKSADWLIDLGPDAGDRGGQLVAQGTPETVAACTQSHTGRALHEVLNLAS